MKKRANSKYPSVTKVLGIYQDFSKIPKHLLDNAIERGIDVHGYAAAYCRNLWFPQNPEYEGFYKSFRDWFDNIVSEVLLVEQRLYNHIHGYTGQLDLLAILKGDTRPTIIDFKTPLRLYPIWAAQGAAYKHLAKKFEPYQVASLRLDPKGGNAKFTDYKDTNRDFKAFLNALYAYKYFMKGGEI